MVIVNVVSDVMRKATKQEETRSGDHKSQNQEGQKGVNQRRKQAAHHSKKSQLTTGLLP